MMMNVIWARNIACELQTSHIFEVFQDKAARKSQESKIGLFVLRLRADQMVWKKEYFNMKVRHMGEKAIWSGTNAECYLLFVQRLEWTRQFERFI